MSKLKCLGGTVMIVPFRINGENYSLEKRALFEKLKPHLSEDKKGIFSSSHYASYCGYHIGNANNDLEMKEKDPYLKVNSLKIKDNSLLKTGKYFMKSESGNLHFKINQIQFILNGNRTNDKLPIGYWVFNFEWQEEDADYILNVLSSSTFFRYHGLEKRKKSAEFYVANDHGESESSESINNILNKELGLNDFKSLDYYQLKPTTLHLLPKVKSGRNSAGIKSYTALRVPPTKWELSKESEGSDLLTLNEISLDAYSIVMDEGAVVFESSVDQFKEIKNKYFPSFLLSLNQREVLNYLTEMTMSNHSQKKQEQLGWQKDLRSVLINTRYHQVFYTISKNSEINLFYRELQKIFSIEESLKDVQESLDSLDQLFDEKEKIKNEQERVENEKRGAQLTKVLFIITFLGVFSAYNDMSDLFDIKGKASPHLIWPAILILGLVGVLIVRKGGKKD